MKLHVAALDGYTLRWLIVCAVRLSALWDRDKHPHPPTPFHVYNLVFRCELLGGDSLTTSTETEGVGFFPKDALPELSLSRVTPQQTQGLIERAVDGQQSADFD